MLHGQYELDKIIRERNAFINKGYVSHGCVRFFNEDMNTLVTLVGKGSAIEILPYAGIGFGGGQIHPKTGKPYRVYGQTGEVPPGEVPPQDLIEGLPENIQVGTTASGRITVGPEKRLASK